MTKLPLVVVEWDDHKGDDGEPVSLETVDSQHKPQIITTIGWVLKEDDKGIFLVTEYYDQTFRGKTFVDKRMIRKITPYKLVKPGKPKALREKPITRPVPSGPTDSAALLQD
jgi:hypothetical protein